MQRHRGIGAIPLMSEFPLFCLCSSDILLAFLLFTTRKVLLSDPLISRDGKKFFWHFLLALGGRGAKAWMNMIGCVKVGDGFGYREKGILVHMQASLFQFLSIVHGLYRFPVGVANNGRVGLDDDSAAVLGNQTDVGSQILATEEIRIVCTFYLLPDEYDEWWRNVSIALGMDTMSLM